MYRNPWDNMSTASVQQYNDVHDDLVSIQYNTHIRITRKIILRPLFLEFNKY